MENANAQTTSTNTTTKAVKVSAFIDDGFTIDGVIEERENLVPETMITYRPYGWMERDKKRRELEMMRPGSDDQYKFRAQLIYEKMEKWSLPRPLTIENIQKLSPAMFDILESILFGLRGPDKIVNTSKTVKLTDREFEDSLAVRNDVKN